MYRKKKEKETELTYSIRVMKRMVMCFNFQNIYMCPSTQRSICSFINSFYVYVDNMMCLILFYSTLFYKVMRIKSKTRQNLVSF